jgi:hypothetical protein
LRCVENIAGIHSVKHLISIVNNFTMNQNNECPTGKWEIEKSFYLDQFIPDGIGKQSYGAFAVGFSQKI